MRVAHVGKRKGAPLPEATLLAWLSMRSRGVTSRRIAAKFGVTEERVRSATNRVKNDDVAHCGEEVLGAYW